MPILAEGRLVDGGRDDVVFAAGDQKERGASTVAVVDLRRRAGVEVRKARLEHDPAGRGDRVQLERLARFAIGHGVRERVPELLKVQWYRPPDICGIQQDRAQR